MVSSCHKTYKSTTKPNKSILGKKVKRSIGKRVLNSGVCGVSSVKRLTFGAKKRHSVKLVVKHRKNHKKSRGVKGKKGSGVTKKSHKKSFYGISDRDFGYIKLDENVHSIRTFGANDAQNNIRKKLNAIERKSRKLEEPEILAKEFAALEELYRDKKVKEKDYFDIKDDMYAELLPSDFDAFEKSQEEGSDNKLYSSINSILSIKPVPNPNPKPEELPFDTLLDQVIAESDNNRSGIFNSDKPRGPKVRTAERAKRGIVDIASAVGDAALVTYNKTGDALTSVGKAVSAAADAGIKGLNVATNVIDATGHFVDATGKIVDATGKVGDLVGTVADTTGKVVDATGKVVTLAGTVADTAGKVVDLAGKGVTLVGTVAYTAGKVVDVAGKGVQLVGDVVDVAGNVVDIGRTGVAIVGDGVNVVGSAAKVVQAGTSALATGAGKLATMATNASNNLK